MAAIRVLIVADQSVTQQGVHAVLTAANDITVMGAATDHQTALTLAKEHRPDLVFLTSDWEPPH